MNINTQISLKDFDGKEIEGFTVGKTIARILSTQPKAQDPMKNFILAQKFYTQDAVEVDQADLNIVKEAVKSSEGFTPIVTGQLLLILEDSKKSE